MAFSITSKAWQRFQLNPTMTSVVFNDRDEQIVFPTVHVCPFYMIDELKIAKIIGELKFLSDGDEIFDFVPNLQLEGDRKMESDQIKKLTSSSSDLESTILNSSLGCSDIFNKCNFKGIEIDCCTFFLLNLSEKGLCFAFKADKLTMTMIEFGDHSLTFETFQPAKIFIHSREESIISQNTNVMQTKLGMSSKIYISMQRTFTDDDAKELEINQRKCVFDGEIESKFYPSEKYSMSRCLRDCKIAKSLQFCGCLSPFYHQMSITNFPKCGFDDLKCLLRENSQPCDVCQLPCDHTNFEIEKISNLQIESSLSITTVDFHHWPYISYYREVRFGFIDFLVAFGSIFTLLLGFSILSAIEILLHIFKTFSRCTK